MEQTAHESKYPAGGPREPVYALMRQLGFSISNWSDKFWNSADGIEVSIFGAGVDGPSHDLYRSGLENIKSDCSDAAQKLLFEAARCIAEARELTIGTFEQDA